MNRPIKDLYISERGSSTNLTMNDYSGYIRELEKYCDKLEEALDTACELIENYHTAIYNLTVGGEFRVIKANEWKEVLLNDRWRVNR